MELQDIGTLSHLNPQRPLTAEQQQVMRDWANEFGHAVRQRSVRQETTMFKCGTCPPSMYDNVGKEPEEQVHCHYLVMLMSMMTFMMLTQIQA